MPDSPVQPDLALAYEGCSVCVTGGAGFIGSTLCRELVNLGARVSVIDDLSHGREENLAELGSSIRFVRGSILDPMALSHAVEGAEIIFHQAALTSVPRSVREPELYHEVNTTGTLRVLEAARTGSAKRLVYASSSSVYGEQAESPKVETMQLDPRSPYAAAKSAGENLLRAYASCYDLSTICLRYFNIFGPNQRPDSPYAAVIPRFAEAMLQSRPITIYGDGSQTRDYTHVANAVSANLLAGATSNKLKGEAINIACGQGLVLSDLVKSISKLLGHTPEIDYQPVRTGEVLHSKANIELARQLIGYEPVMSFEEGLRDALQYYRKLITR